MADKNTQRKKPVSQKRVAVVLASLVGTMTVSAAILLAMEGGALSNGLAGFAVSSQEGIAARIEPVHPLQEKAWNYIIIYESGDLTGSADSLAEGMVTGGDGQAPTQMRPRFHFVVENGQSGPGTKDGELKVGTSWQNQEAGAPDVSWPDPRSYSSKPYNNAVGICVVGDQSRKPMSEAQHQTLLRLVRELQRRLDVPKERVFFQWDTKVRTMRGNAAQQALAEHFRGEL